MRRFSTKNHYVAVVADVPMVTCPQRRRDEYLKAFMQR